jgi:hypothetical protein
MFNHQRGYISILLFAFGIAAALALYPTNFSNDLNKNSINEPVRDCNDNITANQQTIHLPEVNSASGGYNESKPATYKMIRKNIPMLQWFFPGHSQGAADQTVVHGKFYKSVDLDGVNHNVYYPGLGQLDLFEADGTRIRDFLAKDAGLIILAEPNKLSNPIPGFLIRYGDKYGKDPAFVEVNIFQDVSKPPLPQYTLTCEYPYNSTQSSGATRIYEPPQTKSSTNTSLQFQYFTIVKEVPGWTFHCKPAIYLYPKNKMLVNVKVNPKGYFTYTDPLYNPVSGWTGFASPTGIIEVNHILYDYLYYEASIYDHEIRKPTDGYVVEYENLSQLLNNLLPQLGLNPKETFDFKQYWEKTLPKSPYYFVGVMIRENLDYIEPLSIIPEPDSIIRLSLYFEALDQKKEVNRPQIITPVRFGFSVVEWGGLVKLNKEHAFTCSQ